jgi:hypothetical protein
MLRNVTRGGTAINVRPHYHPADVRCDDDGTEYVFVRRDLLDNLAALLDPVIHPDDIINAARDLIDAATDW